MFFMKLENLANHYAIIQTGGKQYQAEQGKTIAIEKLDAAVGDRVSFTEVLMRRLPDGTVEIGHPYLTGPVQASVVKHLRGPKLIAFKFKRRKKYRRKQGHRQPITVVRIESL
jgi:large subunit ribosomal protein L21